jgi:hypothetical protein
MNHDTPLLPDELRRLIAHHGFDAVQAALANFTGVPWAIQLLRDKIVETGDEAAHAAKIHRVTLYKSKAWKAYQAGLKPSHQGEHRP